MRPNSERSEDAIFENSTKECSFHIEWASLRAHSIKTPLWESDRIMPGMVIGPGDYIYYSEYLPRLNNE